MVVLKNLEKEFDPTSKAEAYRILEEAHRNNWLITGLIFVDTTRPTLVDTHNLVETPLNRLADADLRPPREMIAKVNDLMF